MTRYDVVVAGAGPAGSRTAALLAAQGVRVLQVEEHAVAGSPQHCSGLVTQRTLDEANVRQSIVRHRIDGGFIHSKYGADLRLGGERPHAYVIDRPALDRELAAEAMTAGADLRFRHRVEAVERAGGALEVRLATPTCSRTVACDILVGADGANSRVARFIGERPAEDRIRALGAVLEVDAATDEHFVHVFVDNELAPGWFAWAIPAGNRQVRVGIGNTTTSPRPLRPALHALLGQFGSLFPGAQVVSWSGGLIPLYRPAQSHADNVMLVGDAARQVKATSGGGIWMALVGARHAASTAVRALEAQDPSATMLRDYHAGWTRELGGDLRMGLLLRRAADRLSDRQVHHTLQLLDAPVVRTIIQRQGDIDFPGKLYEGLRSNALVWRLLSTLPWSNVELEGA